MPTQVGFIAGLGKVRLTLEPTPQPTAAGGDIIAVAVLVTDRDQVPIEGQAVTFWRGPDEEETTPTDPRGHAAHTFTGLGFGTHSVSIQVSGLSVTFRHTFNPPAAKPPTVPAELKVYAHPEGPAKEYYVSIELPSASGGISDWPVELKDVAHPDAAKRQVTARTGLDGAYRFRINASGPRTIFISVVGTPLDYTLHLPGPERGRIARKVPRAPQAVLDQGLAETLRWFHQEAVKARREGR